MRLKLAVTLALFVVPALAWAGPPENPPLATRVAALEAAVAQLKTSVATLQTTVTGQAGQIRDLTQRVASVEAATQPRYETVNCAQKQTVSSVLNRYSDHVGRLTITIYGVCREIVGITRDDVTLQGGDSGAGLEMSDPEASLTLSNAHGIVLDSLTVRGGSTGISVIRGSSFLGYNLKVEQTSFWGVYVERGSSGFLGPCTLQNNRIGAEAAGGTLELYDCNVTGNQYGVYVDEGGTALVSNSTISGNAVGINLTHHGTVRVSGSTIQNNTTGLGALGNSTATFSNGSRIANNTGAGVAASASSMLHIGETQIADNLTGIVVDHGSYVELAPLLSVRGNTGDGISLFDTSLAFVSGAVVIADNHGWGINCGAPDVLLPLQGQFDFRWISFSGNGADTNCPRPD
jgi:uncharacterized coiled-coil protein SlyX